MNKICTSLEQSKKLIELGIDINTADFMWEYNPDKETYWNKPTIIPIDDYRFVNDVPAWSLAALISIIPYGCLTIHIQKKYRVIYNPNTITEGDYDNPVDACVEMIIKLKEDGYIKL